MDDSTKALCDGLLARAVEQQFRPHHVYYCVGIYGESPERPRDNFARAKLPQIKFTGRPVRLEHNRYDHETGRAVGELKPRVGEVVDQEADVRNGRIFGVVRVPCTEQTRPVIEAIDGGEITGVSTVAASKTTRVPLKDGSGHSDFIERQFTGLSLLRHDDPPRRPGCGIFARAQTFADRNDINVQPLNPHRRTAPSTRPAAMSQQSAPAPAAQQQQQQPPAQSSNAEDAEMVPDAEQLGRKMAEYDQESTDNVRRLFRAKDRQAGLLKSQLEAREKELEEQRRKLSKLEENNKLMEDSYKRLREDQDKKNEEKRGQLEAAMAAIEEKQQLPSYLVNALKAQAEPALKTDPYSADVNPYEYSDNLDTVCTVVQEVECHSDAWASANDRRREAAFSGARSANKDPPAASNQTTDSPSSSAASGTKRPASAAFGIREQASALFHAAPKRQRMYAGSMPNRSRSVWDEVDDEEDF